MTDVDDLVREGLSEEARRARFTPSRWPRTVTDLPAPSGSRFVPRRQVLRTVAGVAAVVLLLAAVVVPLAILSRLGTGSRDAGPGAGVFERIGLRFDLPPGWDKRAFLSIDTRYALLANFEIPPEATGFPSELRDGLRADQVTIFLQELTEICPCPGFERVQGPISITPSDMTSFEGVPHDHAFALRRVVVSERWFDIWVEFGAKPAPDQLVTEVNQILESFRAESDPGWVVTVDVDDAVRITTPATWTWHEDPVPALGEPRILFTTGTWEFPPGGECGPDAALDDLPADGALVWLLEYEIPSNLDDFPLRPDRLSLSGEPQVYECATAQPTYLFRFRDGFRYFQLHVALGDSASEHTRRDVVDVLNSLSAGPLPADERVDRALDLCERLPWVDCPLADWVRNAIWDAGFAVDGRTGSAIVGNADGTSFYMWTTTNPGDPLEPVYVPLMKVDNVTVFSGDTQAVWEARGIRVWVQAGPTDEVLPSREQIEALVRAGLTTPL
jgi:hypothetical protein